jgi:hypothetical protein
MTQEVLCPACGAAVPRGRLSCQECGTMLASVAGTGEPAAPVEPVGPAPAATEHERVVLSRPEPPPSEPAEPTADLEAAVPEAPPPPPEPEPSGAPTTAAQPDPAAAATPPPIIGQWSGPPPEIDVPEEPVLAGGPAMTPTRVTVMGAPTGRQRKFGEPLFPDAGAPPAASPGPATPAPPAAAIVAPPKAAAGWLIVAGGAIAGISFLLPWADSVLGSGSVDDSYVGHWGLAHAPNILLMLAAFGIAYLAVAPIKRFAWLRLGALPIVAGGLLLGVTWPYVLGPYGPRLGMWMMILGAGLLLVGGFVALFERASADDEPPLEADEA